MIIDLLAQHQSTIAFIVAVCGFAWFVKSKLIEILNKLNSINLHLVDLSKEKTGLLLEIKTMRNEISENEIHRNNDISRLSSKFDDYKNRMEKLNDKIIVKLDKK